LPAAKRPSKFARSIRNSDDDIRAAIAYGAEVARERIIPVSVAPAE
jgi:hypothetical protein